MISTIVVLCTVKLGFVKSMEPFVVGGEPARIEYYSYSAFIAIELDIGDFVCGSSILNQNILLSAGHCFEDVGRNSKVIVRAGSANKFGGLFRSAAKTTVHKHYNPRSVTNDIALISLRKPLIFGMYISRIILMEHPPNNKLARVAGWGWIDELKKVDTKWLHQTQQRLWSRDECKKLMPKLPPGTLCGGVNSGKNYVSHGDSGSALVINGNIQVGLVSFKRPEISRSLVVYTDVSYFYSWIVRHARNMLCPKT